MADAYPTVNIRRLIQGDRSWIRAFWQEQWAGDIIVTKGRVHRCDKVDGFVAEVGGEGVGLVTFDTRSGEIEITSLNSLVEGRGIGASLVNAVSDVAHELSANRVALITTNDNTNALRFWQKRGFRMAALYPRPVEESRKLKPGIPLFGVNGIAISDEIELEMPL